MLGKVVLKHFIKIMVVEIDVSPKYWGLYLELSFQYLLSSLVGVCKNVTKTRQSGVANKSCACLYNSNYSRTVIMQNTKTDCHAKYIKTFT